MNLSYSGQLLPLLYNSIRRKSHGNMELNNTSDCSEESATGRLKVKSAV